MNCQCQASDFRQAGIACSSRWLVFVHVLPGQTPESVSEAELSAPPAFCCVAY
jgi:hypothetical protein